MDRAGNPGAADDWTEELPAVHAEITRKLNRPAATAAVPAAVKRAQTAPRPVQVGRSHLDRAGAARPGETCAAGSLRRVQPDG